MIRLSHFTLLVMTLSQMSARAGTFRAQWLTRSVAVKTWGIGVCLRYGHPLLGQITSLEPRGTTASRQQSRRRDTMHLATNSTTNYTFGDASRGDNLLTMNSGAFCEGISVLANVTNDSKWSEASVNLFAA
jgi:hypothetical protein